MVTVLNNENFNNEVLEHEGVVVVDFYADWCRPCMMMVPNVEKLAEERTDVKFCKINVDNAREISQKYGVMSIPTFVVIKDGRTIGEIKGYMSKEVFEEEIDKVL